MPKAKELQRKALTKQNAIYFRWRYVANATRTWREFRSRIGRDEHVRQLARELSERGIVVGQAETRLSDEGRQALAEALAFIVKLSQRSEVQSIVSEGLNRGRAKDYLVRIVPWEFKHTADSPLLKLALDRKLLEIVSAYLGMWPRLHGVGAWLNLPTESQPKKSQLWHRDPEDLKLIKVFIYLNDVGVDNGPFCYIPKSHPFSSGAGKVPLHKGDKRILDDEMTTAFPEDSWVECTGPANTMIIADTVGFHRGGRVKTGTRLLLTFTYTSGKPLVERDLLVSGSPVWISHPIQRLALEGPNQ
jgi:hypothetical protein